MLTVDDPHMIGREIVARAAWRDMIRFAHANGVSVHKRWRESFALFVEDMGLPSVELRRPFVHRVDQSKGFNKRNCQYAGR